ncbi:MAG: hypothetical protein EOM68_08945 [Spirochaetia bacterium]|nr:hypothetical protein [Spirochaetia bacterium]
MSRPSQTSRRYSKIGIILIVFFCTWHSLFSAIVLETPQTEVKLFVSDLKSERDTTPTTSQLLPLCSILIIAKHRGQGYLLVTHTPLVSPLEVVSYELFCETRQENIFDALSYSCNPFLPLTIPLTKLSVQLAKPLQGARSSYSSDVFVHLKLEA